MLEVGNQQKSTGTDTRPAAKIVIGSVWGIEPLSEEAVETGTLLSEYNCDTLTIKVGSEKPVVERPKNFINSFQNDNGLCSRLHNQLGDLFINYSKGYTDKAAVMRTVDQAVSSLGSVHIRASITRAK